MTLSLALALSLRFRQRRVLPKRWRQPFCRLEISPVATLFCKNYPFRRSQQPVSHNPPETVFASFLTFDPLKRVA
jgi:hypothetical protein